MIIQGGPLCLYFWTRARGTKVAADGVDLDELESLHASLDKEAAVGSA